MTRTEADDLYELLRHVPDMSVIFDSTSNQMSITYSGVTQFLSWTFFVDPPTQQPTPNSPTTFISPVPGAYTTPGPGTVTINKSVFTFGNLSTVPITITLPSVDSKDIQFEIHRDLPKTCECGADKHGFASHSKWCAKYA